jgi:DNA-directed RNA polymerase subunit P
MTYKCARCKEPMRADVNTVGLQCERCGSKVFYKDRPTTQKTIKAV